MKDTVKTPSDDDIISCATDIVRTESACIEWGATAERSVQLADIRIREMLNLPQKFSKERL